MNSHLIQVIDVDVTANSKDESTFVDVLHDSPLYVLLLATSFILMLVGALPEVTAFNIHVKGKSPALFFLGIVVFVSGIFIHPSVDAIGILEKRRGDRIQVMENSVLGSLDAGDLDSAIQSLNNLIKTQPNDISTLNELARVHLLKSVKNKSDMPDQDFYKAFNINKRAYQIGPRNSDIWILRAFIYWRRATFADVKSSERQKLFEEAVRYIDLAISKNESWKLFTPAKALCTKSLLLQQQNRQEESNQAKEDALAASPSSKCN